MRPLFILLLSFLTLPGSLVQADLIVLLNTSAYVSSPLANIECIRFENGQMITRLTNQETQSLPISTIKNCFFNSANLSGIQDVNTDNFLNTLTPTGSLLQVSNEAGMLVINQQVTSAYIQPLLDKLPKGIYFVRLNNRSLKIQKK